MATIISTFTEVMLADTRRRPGTVLLPPLSAIPYRMLTFKDVYGTFSNSTLTLSTQSGNTFEDSTTSVVLSNAYSFFNLYAGSTSWLVLDGTQTTVQSISTLNVNSINIGNGLGWLQLGPIQTVALSTTQIFTDSLYVNTVSSFSLSTGQLQVSSITGISLVNTSNLVSTTIGLQTFVSTFIDPNELASTVSNLISSTFFAAQLASTVGGLGQAGYVSTAALSGLISTPNLLNLISTANLSGLVSTPNLQNLVSTQNLSGFVSTPNLLNLISTANLLGLVSTPNLQNLVSTQNLSGLISTQNLSGLVSTPNLLNLISTANLSGLVSTPNLVDLISTAYLDSQLASTVGGLGQAGYVSTAALAGLVSTQNLNDLVSTPNLTDLVSTSYLFSQLSNWALYPATAGVVLQQSYPLIVNPVDDTQCIFQSQNLFLQDKNAAPGSFFANLYGITTSTNSALYGFTYREDVTGTVSSASLVYSDGLTTQMGSLFLSSIYLGKLGGILIGQLTTDDTASDIYWNGSSLTTGGGGGGGITTGDLVSTVAGLGESGYLSTISEFVSTQFLSAAQVQVSSISFRDSLGLLDAITYFYQTGTTLVAKAKGGFGVTNDSDELDNIFANKYSIIKASLTGAAEYSYTLTGGTYTGIISTPTFVENINDTVTSLYISSLFLGNNGASLYGEITTDDTATNLYWKGVQLNGGGGGGVTTANLVSTTSGLQTNFIGQEGYFSTLFVNLTSATAPVWDSNMPIAGSDPEPNPLAFDLYGSARILKNLYVGSTTTVIGTAGIYAQTVSTNITTAKQMNFSSLFVNNAPIIVDSNGNLIATTQVF